MNYSIVQCEVHYLALVEYTDSSGTYINSRETVGDFDNKTDAEYALAEAGLTRHSWGWQGNYSRGYVSRILKELPNVN